MATEDYLNIDYRGILEDDQKEMHADDRCIYCDTTRSEAQESSLGMACLKSPDESFMHKFGPKRLEKGKQYVVGFAFDDTFTSVLLVRKKRPEDQAGKLNGPGGKVEDQDRELAHICENVADSTSPTAPLVVQIAMAREFLEETGIQTSPDQWTPFICFNDIRGWQIIFMFTTCNIWDYVQKTDEQVIPFNLELLHTKGVYTLIPNLNWLIPMALTKHPKLPITDCPDIAEFFTLTESSHVAF